MRVIVIGAGIIGAACARAIAADGHQVTVVDRAGSGEGTSSSGEGNLLVSDKGPGPELELAQRSVQLWGALNGELAEELQRDPAIEFEQKGGVVVALTAPGAHALDAFAATQRAAGVDAQPVDAQHVRSLEPWLTPRVVGGVHYPEDGQVQPVAATEALLASARARGARVLQGHEVIGPLSDSLGGLVGVRTQYADLPADRVLVAAGPWSAQVSGALGVSLPVRPRRGMLLVTSRMPPRILHKVYDGDYVGAVSSGDGQLQVSSVVESTAAGTVLIGSSRERVGFDQTLRVEVLREIAHRAVSLFPFLADQVVMRTYGGFRPYVPDHLPLIGPDPRLPGLWHATGHEGAGIGLSLATAELLADQLSGRRGVLDPAPYAVDRPGLESAIGQEAI